MTAHLMRRAYIRHPSDMPIELREEGQDRAGEQSLKDVSLGGIACRSAHPHQIGTVVSLLIGVTEPPFKMRGRVAWCVQQGADFELGVQFLAHDDAFAARMVEQVCHIEQYRHEVLRNEGRVLGSEEAAREWVSKYAPSFPSNDDLQAG